MCIESYQCTVFTVHTVVAKIFSQYFILMTFLGLLNSQVIWEQVYTKLV